MPDEVGTQLLKGIIASLQDRDTVKDPLSEHEWNWLLSIRDDIALELDTEYLRLQKRRN